MAAYGFLLDSYAIIIIIQGTDIGWVQRDEVLNERWAVLMSICIYMNMINIKTILIMITVLYKDVYAYVDVVYVNITQLLRISHVLLYIFM